MQAKILKRIVTALLLSLFVLGPAQAQSTEDALLEQLRDAPEKEAKRLERELSLIWDRSGSASMDLLLKRGREALEEEDNTRAIEHFSALIDHAPEFAEGWHARATAYFRAGLYGPALDDLQRALILNPNNYNALFGLGVMFQEFGDTARAAEAFDRVLDIHPNHARAKEARKRLIGRGINETL
ncbi:MAG: tetratricopeptide repeat protein [Pseudomonadota bacterium]